VWGIFGDRASVAEQYRKVFVLFYAQPNGGLGSLEALEAPKALEAQIF
jgi:hypothetical protein